MKFNQGEPTRVGMDILILLNDSEIHEGKFVKILGKDDKVYKLYHIYKTNQYLSPMEVHGWLSKSELAPNAYKEYFEPYIRVGDNDNPIIIPNVKGVIPTEEIHQSDRKE